jgi:hypothetical protein
LTGINYLQTYWRLSLGNVRTFRKRAKEVVATEEPK